MSDYFSDREYGTRARCDAGALGAAVAGEMPGLSWPLQVTQDVEGGFMREAQAFAPELHWSSISLEFVYASVAKPVVVGAYHDYFRHHHLTFDQQTGQDEFRATVNRLFARNGLATNHGVVGSNPASRTI